jgi:hypothetical protein
MHGGMDGWTMLTRNRRALGAWIVFITSRLFTSTTGSNRLSAP